MKKYSLETSVGVMVFVGLLCVAYLTVKLGKMEVFGGNHYTLKTTFSDVTGLREGGAVEMSGVQIGTVDQITLDPQEQIAIVQLKIKKDVAITDDAIASIKTSGLIGDKFVKITSGGSDQILGPGGIITDTESAIDLEELISKYIFGNV